MATAIDLEAIRRRIAERLEQDALRRQRFGEVRDLITATYHGHRFVAVGNRLYFNKDWRTFTDFLLAYVRDLMGRDWWMAERAKKPSERHPVMKWFDHWYEVSANTKPNADGIRASIPDGVMSALNLFAYDLYILRHHSQFQEEALARLRHADQFYGARYELFVAATFVRAGCTFQYEDETDGKRKHPEFTATFPGVGFKAAVEAKARQRQIKEKDFDIATIKPPVRDLLLSAASKASEIPLVVFLELNLPPEATAVPTWVAEVNEVVSDIARERGKSPFAAVIFTNRPHLYALPGSPDPEHQVFAVWPVVAGLPEQFVNQLGIAAKQYGNVPSLFPDGFGKREG